MNNNYVKVIIIGKNPKLFFKRYILGKITFKNFVDKGYKEILLDIKYDDYLYLNEIKSTYKVNLIKYYGLYKIKHLIVSNFSFFISFIVSLIILFFLSNTCFNIEIVHNDSKLRNLIKEELNDNGIRKMSIIPSFNKRKQIIEKIIKENKNDIEWLEIERKGSKLIVKVTERKLNNNQDNLPNRHIVAKKSGIIKKIEATNGVIMKKVNDYVNKGDIVISGDIIKDETVKGQVPAKGAVYAEVWYKVNVSYPLYYKEVRYLDDVKQNIIISLFDKDFALRKNYTNSYLEKKKTFIKDKVFPFSISLLKQRKTNVIKKEYTKQQALKKASELAEDKLSVKLRKDEYIMDKKTLNYSINNSTIIVDVFFKVYENITDYKQTDLILTKEE